MARWTHDFFNCGSVSWVRGWMGLRGSGGKCRVRRRGDRGRDAMRASSVDIVASTAARVIGITVLWCTLTASRSPRSLLPHRRRTAALRRKVASPFAPSPLRRRAIRHPRPAIRQLSPAAQHSSSPRFNRPETGSRSTARPGVPSGRGLVYPGISHSCFYYTLSSSF